MPQVIGRISFQPRIDDPFGDLVIDDVACAAPPVRLDITVDEAADEGLRYSVQQVYDFTWPSTPAPEAA